MNTTRLTFDHQIEYTIVGDVPTDPGDKPAIVLLNRSPRMFRSEYLSALMAAGFREIISVEPGENAYSVESLAGEFPYVRFLLVSEEIDTGTQIALAFANTGATSAIVTWSTIGPPVGTERAKMRLEEEGVVCVAPLLRNERGEALPVRITPMLSKRMLRVMRLSIRGDTTCTLFLDDYVGLYNIARFRESGGFDRQIPGPFWQLADFGFRTYLWGSRIPIVTGFKMDYQTLPNPVDETAKSGYARFYARNLAVRVNDREVGIPTMAAIGFALRSGFGVLRTIRVFSAAKKWIEENRERFMMDARKLIDQWENEDE